MSESRPLGLSPRAIETSWALAESYRDLLSFRTTGGRIARDFHVVERFQGLYAEILWDIHANQGAGRKARKSQPLQCENVWQI